VKKRWMIVVGCALFLGVAAIAGAAAPKFHEANPGEFDPGKTFLVQSTWLDGIGCPTVGATSTACTTNDATDKHNQGLLLAKTGPSSTNASAFAVLKDVAGITLTELGYDLRKPGVSHLDPRGSHCDNGSPRFNVETTAGFFFVGCNSPTPVVTTTGDGWQRLRWDATGIPGTVKSIAVLFDDGQDTGPDNFGLSVLDNIDVNSTLVGHGPTNN
jgi:hypothetical protein